MAGDAETRVDRLPLVESLLFHRGEGQRRGGGARGRCLTGPRQSREESRGALSDFIAGARERGQCGRFASQGHGRRGASSAPGGGRTARFTPRKGGRAARSAT